MITSFPVVKAKVYTATIKTQTPFNGESIDNFVDIYFHQTEEGKIYYQAVFHPDYPYCRESQGAFIQSDSLSFCLKVCRDIPMTNQETQFYRIEPDGEKVACFWTNTI